MPLRATIALALSRQEIEFKFGKAGGAAGKGKGGKAPAGTNPLQSAQTGDSLQKLAGRVARSGDWKAIAAANGIDDAIRLDAGALIDVNAGLSLAGMKRS